MSVFDVRGRWVKDIFAGEVDSGEHRAGWDGTDASGVRMASGFYFVRITSQNHACFAKVLLQHSGKQRSR
jgi:flagellar hook assembly protein FlgD